MTQARLHVLQHVPFEDAAHIGTWARDRGLAVSRTLLFERTLMPGTNGSEWLVVMGGPMGRHSSSRR